MNAELGEYRKKIQALQRPPAEPPLEEEKTPELDPAKRGKSRTADPQKLEKANSKVQPRNRKPTKGRGPKDEQSVEP